MFDELPGDVNLRMSPSRAHGALRALQTAWCSCRADFPQEDEAPLTEMIDLEAQDDSPANYDDHRR